MITKTTEKSGLIKAANEEGLAHALWELWDYNSYEQEYPKVMEANLHAMWVGLQKRRQFDFIIPFLAHEIKGKAWPEQVIQQFPIFGDWSSSLITIIHNNPQYIKTFCHFSVYKNALHRISLLWQLEDSIVVYSHYKRIKVKRFVISIIDCVEILNYGMKVWYESSFRWRERSRKLREKKGACEECDGTKRLCTHHLTYENIGYEKDEDLMVLCGKCHGSEHARLRRAAEKDDWKSWFMEEKKEAVEFLDFA